MTPTLRTVLSAVATATLMCQAAAVSAQEAPALGQTAPAGQKLDSGLGELPHYRYWSDPTGKAPMAPATARLAGQKIDSGLGELPHYRYWADPTGKAPLRTEQLVAESSPRR